MRSGAASGSESFGPPARTHRVLHAGRRGQDRRSVRETRRGWACRRLAMTDHGNVFGAYEFWKQATSAGVKPIIGMEAYLTPGTSRFDRSRVRWADGGEDDVSGGGAYTHMTMLAADTGGMHNLFRLASPGQPRGALLQAADGPRAAPAGTARGLIATTGCPSGEVQIRLRLGQYDDAGAGRRGVPGHLRRGATSSAS